MFSNELWQKSGVSTYSIDQSIRFNSADSAYMEKTFSGAGNQKQFTISLWLKRSLLGSRQDIWSFQQDVPILFQSDDTFLVALFGTTSLVTNRKFRDPSAWYHFVLTVDSTNQISTDRIRLYVNGQRETSFSTESYPSLNADANVWTSGLALRLFRLYGGTNYYDGYAAEIHYLDGISYGPEYFGETNSSGIWIPKEYDGSYGSNGFKIDGRDSSDLGDDESGNGNDFTTSGLAAHDQVLDTPTNNFAVYNILYNVGDVDFPIYSEGNLSVDFNFFGKRSPVSTFALPTDSDAYCEFYIKTSASSVHNSGVGIGQGDANNAGNIALTNGVTYNFNGNKHTGDGTATSFGNTYTAGDIIGVYFDQSDNEVDFYKNNTLEGSLSLSSYSGDLFFLVANNVTSQQVIIANFGQDDTFAGNKTSGSAGASDSSGNGKFYYTRISGAKALCSKSLGS